jgi:hypothetical protein
MSDDREYDSEDIMQFVDKEPAESAPGPTSAKDAPSEGAKRCAVLAWRSHEHPGGMDWIDTAAAEIERFAQERMVTTVCRWKNERDSARRKLEAAEADARAWESTALSRQAEAKALREALERITVGTILTYSQLDRGERYRHGYEDASLWAVNIARAAVALREAK